MNEGVRAVTENAGRSVFGANADSSHPQRRRGVCSLGNADPLSVSRCCLGFEDDLDSLGERARCNYFYARALTGREFAWPAVRPGALQ